MDNPFNSALGASGVVGGSPCFGCESRNIGCHDGCPKFLQWRARLDEARKEMKKYMIAEDYERTQRGLRELRRYVYHDDAR